MEGFPQMPPMGGEMGNMGMGVAGSGLIDALRGNPQLLKLLLLGLSGMGRQSAQPGMPTSGATGDPLSTILNLYAMKQMMGNRQMSQTGMEGSPNMPASSVAGGGMSNPMSWLSSLSSLLSGGGGG